MFERIGDLLSLYVFGTGSMLFCLQDMDKKAQSLGNDPLVERIQDALALNARARKSHFQWETQKRDDPQVRRAAVNRDNKIDRTIGQIYRITKSYAGVEADLPVKEAGQTIKDGLFSRGIAPIVHATFEEQHVLNKELIDRLRNDYADEVEILGLTPLVDTLADHNAAFRRELNVTRDEYLTYDEVQSARAEAQDAFHKVIFHIVGDYLDDLDAALDLLATVEDQQERISRYRRRRGSRPEVDPSTGEVIDIDEELDIEDPDAVNDDPPPLEPVSDEPQPEADEAPASAE